MLQYQISDLVKIDAAFGRFESSPGWERRFGSGNSVVDILLGGFANGSYFLMVVWGKEIKCFTIRRGNKLR
jgi:hypothetical protein